MLWLAQFNQGKCITALVNCYHLQNRSKKSETIPIMIDANQSSLIYDTQCIFSGYSRHDIHDP
ncbi:hypothetical protein Lal_00026874 [Lupinus albus]|nr:hypothetical protein Lal_00026874 [Lupinus albus]